MFHSIRVPSQAIRGPQWKPDRGLDLANTDHSHWREQAASRGPPGAFQVSGDGPPPTGRLRHVKFRKQEAGTGRSRSRADKCPGDRSSRPFPGAMSGPRGPNRDQTYAGSPPPPIFIVSLTGHFRAGPELGQGESASRGAGNRHRIVTLCARCRHTAPRPVPAVPGHPWLRSPAVTRGQPRPQKT